MRASERRAKGYTGLASASAACVSTWLGEDWLIVIGWLMAGRLDVTLTSSPEPFARALSLGCRGDTRPARGSKLTLLSQLLFARTVDGYHPSISGAFCLRQSAARGLTGKLRAARGSGITATTRGRPGKVWQRA